MSGISWTKLVDPTYTISETLTPLLLACSEGHLDVVKFLIEKGCDHTQTFQVKDGYVANLLHLTAMGGHVDTARYLIEEKECDPTSKTIIDHTPLSLACENGHLEMVKYLVNERSIDPVHQLNNGKTPLHLACNEGHLEIVKFLIEEKGCDPMYDVGMALTPYAAACGGEDLDVVRYLTEERQCDPMCENMYGVPAISVAFVGNLDILKYLVEERRCALDSGHILDILRVAIQMDNLDAVEYLTSLVAPGAGKLYQKFALYHGILLILGCMGSVARCNAESLRCSLRFYSF